MCLKSLRFMHMPNRSPKVRFGTEALAKCPPCSCGAGADGGPERHEPGCDRALEPHVGYDTWCLIGVALNCLLGSRGGSPADPRVELSCLASLLAEAQSRVPDAVTDGKCSGRRGRGRHPRVAVEQVDKCGDGRYAVLACC